MMDRAWDLAKRSYETLFKSALGEVTEMSWRGEVQAC